MLQTGVMRSVHVRRLNKKITFEIPAAVLLASPSRARTAKVFPSMTVDDVADGKLAESTRVVVAGEILQASVLATTSTSFWFQKVVLVCVAFVCDFICAVPAALWRAN